MADGIDMGAFALRLTARCGAPILAGGLCIPGAEDAGKQAVRSLSDLSFSQAHDPAEVDRMLAHTLAEACGPDIPAVGACVRVDGFLSRCGGVLGSPRNRPEPANGSVEDLGYGLYLFAQPGGPGYVVRCPSRREADAVRAAMPRETGEARRWLLQRGVDTWMAVGDGSGPEARGFLWVKTPRFCREEYL